MAFLRAVLFLLLLLMNYCTGSNMTCPGQAGLIGEEQLFPFIGRLNASTNDLMKSFDDSCDMKWINKEHIRNKFNDRLKKGEKQFFRLRLPVAINSTLHYVTVVWVNVDNKYMLHFPHNFQTLSLATMTIISENLKNNHIYWSCPSSSNCSLCGMGMKALAELLTNLTSNHTKYDWKYLCIPASYGMEHLLDEYPLSWSGLSLLNTYDFALPDLVYYWYFYKKLFNSRPSFGIPSTKEDFPNYYCYEKDTGECVIKELLMKYYILVYTAIGMWCYMPLLVYYLPSSSGSTRSGTTPQGMIPAYKSPIHFTQCLQKIFCYYVRDYHGGYWWKIRLRRCAVFIFLLLGSFRLLILPDYRFLGFGLLFLQVIALIPSNLSKGIQTEVPKCFPLFPNQPYPKGMIKWNDFKGRTIEFQRLAYIMQERILLVFDTQFGNFIITNSFKLLTECLQNAKNDNFVVLSLKAIVYFIIGVCTLLLAVILILSYFLLPMAFFCKEIVFAIWRLNHGGSRWFLRIICNICLTGLFVYILVVFLSLSQLINDMTIFTYIGAVLTPSMALEYVTLLVAFTTTVVTMIIELQGGYTDILNTIIEILKDKESFNKLQTKLSSNPNINIVLVKKDDNVEVYKKNSTIVYCSLLQKETFNFSVNKELFESIIEAYRPVRRAVSLIVIKVLLTLYFIGIAMWIKNVFHIESKVSNIFSLANKFGIFFLPAALEFLSYKGKFGKKSETILKNEVFEVMCNYLEFLV